MADIDKIKDPPYDRYDLWRIFSYLPNKLSDSDNLQKTVAAGKPRMREHFWIKDEGRGGQELCDALTDQVGFHGAFVNTFAFNA